MFKKKEGPAETGCGNSIIRTMTGWAFKGFVVFLCGFVICILFTCLFSLLPYVNLLGYAAFSYDEQTMLCYFILPFGAANVLMLFGILKFIRYVVKKLYKWCSFIGIHVFGWPEKEKDA